MVKVVNAAWHNSARKNCLISIGYSYRTKKYRKRCEIMLGRKKLIIEPAWCKGCGICAAFCPKQVLEIVKEKVTLKNPEQCIACGFCEMRCPDYAIYLVNVEE